MENFIFHRDALLKEHRGPRQGVTFAQKYAQLMDAHLKDLYEAAAGNGAKTPGLALAALGGYGRGEMSPHSDVDLLFLTATNKDQETYKPLIEAMLYPLWDLKLDVGQAVRTPSQCLEMGQEDFATLSTQLDSRFLMGDMTLFAEFAEKLYRYLAARPRKKAFFDHLSEFVESRYKKHGQSPYLLEPNVKEGQGGLRDIHAIRWAAMGLYDFSEVEDMVAKGFLAADRLRDLEEARAFTTDLRHHLHMLAGRKIDTLTFDLQVDVAKHLSYEDDDHQAGVEKFMQDYYTRVYKTKSTLDYFLSRVREDLIPLRVWKMTQRPRRVERGLSILRGQIELSGRDDVRDRPILIMRAWEVSATSGLPISQRSLELIRTNLDLVDDDYRTDPKVVRSFLNALCAVPPKRSKTDYLDAGQALPLLEAFIPELASVKAQVQHDAYHVYTVDVHLIRTLWELKKIALGLGDPSGPGEADFEFQVFEAVEDKEALFLAALLHDIGKGKGSDHASLGADMIPRIGWRLGLSERTTDTIRFLIQEHLFLVRTAMRRDLTEEKLIVSCARRIGDVDRLNMLFLLTMADSRATGSDVMNHWKASLLLDLHAKINRVLTRSDLGGRAMTERTDKLLLQVAKRLGDKLPGVEVDAHLEKMSAHYLSVMDADTVVRHILLERHMTETGEPIIWEVEAKDEGYCEVTILAEDRPGLLSRMAGVFTIHHINILGAQVFTRANNIALDVFQVEHPPDRVFEDEIWEKVKTDARKVLTGQMALDFRVSQKRPLLKRTKPVTQKPDKVVVDIETSDFYTIVEVYTYDRLGLLYEVTKALYDLQLSIYIAKISTQVEQVVDVFYVKDFFGQKLTNREQIQELKDALYFTLAR
jgi:[protein-PII] uridylyltransferase